MILKIKQQEQAAMGKAKPNNTLASYRQRMNVTSIVGVIPKDVTTVAQRCRHWLELELYKFLLLCRLPISFFILLL
jgi:hypothetical protein